MSVRKMILALAALGLLAASTTVSWPDRAVPGLGDRDFGGNPGHGQ